MQNRRYPRESYRKWLQILSDHKALNEMSKNLGWEWSSRAAGGGGGVTGTSFGCGEDVRRLCGRWRCTVTAAAAGREVGGLFSRRGPHDRVARSAGGSTAAEEDESQETKGVRSISLIPGDLF